MAFSPEKMDDLRHDAMVEAMLDEQYAMHDTHFDFPDPDCWLCRERDEDED